ncbi:MAG: 1-pyrroline-5-carboxylate dehydrogenase [Pseudomonadota bacterium]
MLRALFSNNIYIKVYANRFVLRKLGDGARSVTVMADEPFTTERLLVGQFAVAEHLLKRGLTELVAGNWFAPSPVVVIHPLEKVEGGLSEVEERIFRELAAGAGARKVVLWLGRELSDAEAKQQAARA